MNGPHVPSLVARLPHPTMNAKAAASRYQRQVGELARLPGNEVCADCGGRNPRWASHNLGIFLCVQCAGVHRKMGTHISKVKSLTLDEWTKEQVERMREFGNLKSNRYYNPNEQRNRPPANVDDNERDNELERFIRNKYEYRRYMDRAPPPVPRKDPAKSPSGYLSPRSGPSSSGTSSGSRSTSGPAVMSHSNGNDIHRSRTAPIPSTWKEAKRAASPLPALPKGDASPPSSARPAAVAPSQTMPAISVSSYGSAGPSNGPSSSAAQSSNHALSLPTPTLPQRASSAQGYAQPLSPSLQNQQQQQQQSLSHFQSHFHSQYQSQPQSSNAPFAGRSEVFDDLLSLGQPQAPSQQQVYPQMTAINPWPNNAWQQQQQQQQSYQQPMFSPQEMGNMAFFPQQQQQMYGMQQMSTLQPQLSPSNPFWAQQQQQQQPQQTGYFPQQQQQPHSVAQQYQQQRLQTGQVFDDWAKGMMPGMKR